MGMSPGEAQELSQHTHAGTKNGHVPNWHPGTQPTRTPGHQEWACPPGEAEETSHPVPAAAVGPPPKWTLAAAGGYRSLKPDEAAKEDR